MKNVDISNILFSIFSTNIITYPVKNKINPITLSDKKLKELLEEKSILKPNKLIRAKSAININELIPKKLIGKYIIDKTKINNINNLIFKKEKNYENIKVDTRKSLQELMKDFIVIKSSPLIKNKNLFYKLINDKNIKSSEEPYKKYLYDKMKIENAKKMKEIENKYIMESKRQKRLKYENDIRNKYQGLDFSKQRKRELFMEKYIRSKKYEKIEDKKRNETNEFDIKFFTKQFEFEVNEKKYPFLDSKNKGFVPSNKYNAFKERFKIFNWNLKENPDYSNLIKYISNK